MRLVRSVWARAARIVPVFGEAAVDGVDQVVHAAREAVELGVGEACLDALGEIPADRGIDHPAEGTLQILHHLGALDAALFRAHALLIGEGVHLPRILAEDFNGAAHGADLVLALRALHVGLEVALGERLHCRGEPAERLGDRAGDEEADRRNEEQQHAADAQDEISHAHDGRQHFVGGDDADQRSLLVDEAQRHGGGQHREAAIGRIALPQPARERLVERPEP